VTSAADHKPTQPCVVSAEGHTGAVEATFVVTVGASEQFLVEKLNNGKYRVTRGTGGKIGTGVGAGFDLSATWDDKTYGATAKADASVADTFSGGEVYYVDSKAEVANLMSAHREAVAKEVVSDSGGFGSLAVGAVNLAEDVFHVGYDFPPVDETYIQGGASVDMSAQLTALAANAKAEGSAQAVLGIRQGADGTSTTYYKVSADLNLGAGIWTSDAQTGQAAYGKAVLERKKESIVEVERDAKGIITAVRDRSAESGNTEATAAESANSGPGKNEYSTETVAELPIRSVIDQGIAQRYLNAAGLGSMGGFTDLPETAQSSLPIMNQSDATGAADAFSQAAGTRGFVTKQTFDDSASGAYGANFDAEYLAKVSGGVKVDVVGRKSTGAQYWDVSTMVPWKGCGGK